MKTSIPIVFGVWLLAAAVLATPGEQYGSAKEALQELQEYVGGWKGNGTSDRDKTAIWKEAMSWTWRFKGDDAWLTLEVKESKYYKAGELRYLTAKKVFQLKLTDKSDKSMVFEGTIQKKKYLTLQRVDADAKQTQEIKFNTASDGDRLVLTYSVMPENRKQFTQEWQVGMTRDGVSLAAGKKGPECVVTGGLGTTTVSYKGMTYYVCCSGCRDAFNENPEKILKEYAAKKKGGN
jgi:hypothetical protein